MADPLGRSIAAAAALIAVAGLLYLAALADTQLFGAGGFGEPCEFAADAGDGAVLGQETSLWPPGVSCETIQPDGVVIVVTRKWSWVGPAVAACLIAAAALLAAGALASRRT